MDRVTRSAQDRIWLVVERGYDHDVMGTVRFIVCKIIDLLTYDISTCMLHFGRKIGLSYTEDLHSL
jgi:hypothetical protein